MTTYYKRKNRIAAKALAPLLAAAIILPLILFRGNALADSNLATDVLHVLVGYSGMEFDEYVEVGTYPWYEIEQTLPVYEELQQWIYHAYLW